MSRRESGRVWAMSRSVAAGVGRPRVDDPGTSQACENHRVAIPTWHGARLFGARVVVLFLGGVGPTEASGPPVVVGDESHGLGDKALVARQVVVVDDVALRDREPPPWENLQGDVDDGGMRHLTLTLILVLLAACSDTEPPEPSSAQVTFVNEIATCDNVDGRGIAGGTIENTGSAVATFRIELEFSDDTTGEVLAAGVAVIRSVEPGQAGEWTIEAEDVGDSGLSCASKSISGSS